MAVHPTGSHVFVSTSAGARLVRSEPFEFSEPLRFVNPDRKLRVLRPARAVFRGEDLFVFVFAQDTPQALQQEGAILRYRIRDLLRR
jgi:hypothetical protein